MTEREKLIQIYRDVLSGKRCRFPNHFFVGDQGKTYLAELTRYLIEEYLAIPIEQIPQYVSAEVIWGHRLRPGAQTHGFDFIEVIENAYPNRFKPWDFKQVSNGYWQGEDGRQRAIETVRYVIEEKCKIPHREIPDRITHQFFEDHRIRGVFSLFGQSPYQVINAVYPNEFKPWDFSTVPLNFWKNPLNTKQAMDWFLFEVVGFSSYSEAFIRLRQEHFIQHEFTGCLQMAFNRKLAKVKQWIKEQEERCVHDDAKNGNAMFPEV